MSTFRIYRNDFTRSYPYLPIVSNDESLQESTGLQGKRNGRELSLVCPLGESSRQNLQTLQSGSRGRPRGRGGLPGFR